MFVYIIHDKNWYSLHLDSVGMLKSGIIFTMKC